MSYLVLRKQKPNFCKITVEEQIVTPCTVYWPTTNPHLVYERVTQKFKRAHMAGHLFAVSPEEVELFVSHDKVLGALLSDLCPPVNPKPKPNKWAEFGIFYLYILGGSLLIAAAITNAIFWVLVVVIGTLYAMRK